MSPARKSKIKPAPLTHRIANIEKRIVERQQSIRMTTKSCVQDLRKNIVSTPMLLTVAGIGFIFGRVTRRRSIALDKGTNNVSGMQKLSADLLKLIAFVRTLSPVWQLLSTRLFPK
jgi:hypothetical protein